MNGFTSKSDCSAAITTQQHQLIWMEDNTFSLFTSHLQGSSMESNPLQLNIMLYIKW